MNLQDQREEIAEILSGVSGVTGTRYRPRVIGPGSAWPMLGELLRDEQTPDLEVVWKVVVILPGDELAAAVWFDENAEPLDDAFQDYAYVEGFTPATVATSVGDLQAMIITIRREA